MIALDGLSLNETFQQRNVKKRQKIATEHRDF